MTTRTSTVIVVKLFHVHYEIKANNIGKQHMPLTVSSTFFILVWNMRIVTE